MVRAGFKPQEAERKANLATVGVPADDDVRVSMGKYVVRFRTVGKQEMGDVRRLAFGQPFSDIARRIQYSGKLELPSVLERDKRALVFQHGDSRLFQFPAPVVPAEGEIMVSLDSEDPAGSRQAFQQPGGRSGIHAGVFAASPGIVSNQQNQVRLEPHDPLNIAQGPHFIKRGGHQVQIAGNNDFNGRSLPFPLGDTVVHFPDKQKIGFYQVRPGHAGHAERAEAQQENAEKPEYFDGKGHEKDTAWQRL